MMRIKKILTCILICNFSIINAQNTYVIRGQFHQVKEAEIELIGFDAFKDILLAKTQCDSAGNFTMSYPKTYTGAATLRVDDKTSLIVLLNKENFSVNWSDFMNLKTLTFINSPENDAFEKGMKICQEAENILSGLRYLKPYYENSPGELKWLNREIVLKENALPVFSKKMQQNSYAGYYLSVRKLLQDMPITANRYFERMPEHEKQFAAIDFSDERVLHSGLLKGLIDGFYLLMESYGDINTVAPHANAATTALLKSLDKNPDLKQETAEYLFKYLEKRSLFKPAEFLAQTMLNDSSCSLDANSIAMYEQYRKMGIGQTGLDIELVSSEKNITKLSDIHAKFKLVVFGSSWCPKCQEEFPQLKNQYTEWKSKYNLEIIYVSLDTDFIKHQSFSNDFSWITSCDLKGWKTKSAVDYCVFATPTMYLLDTNDRILLKPFSAGQINSWLIGNGERI